MGYGGVSQASTFALGIPAAVPTAFMIEGTWARILPSHEQAFRDLLDKMDALEAQLVEEQGDLAVEEIGDIKVNLKHFHHVMELYKYWQGRLANMLQVPPNPFDQRFTSWTGGGSGMNIPVQN